MILQDRVTEGMTNLAITTGIRGTAEQEICLVGDREKSWCFSGIPGGAEDYNRPFVLFDSPPESVCSAFLLVDRFFGG